MKDGTYTTKTTAVCDQLIGKECQICGETFSISLGEHKVLCHKCQKALKNLVKWEESGRPCN